MPAASAAARTALIITIVAFIQDINIACGEQQSGGAKLKKKKNDGDWQENSGSEREGRAFCGSRLLRAVRYHRMITCTLYYTTVQSYVLYESIVGSLVSSGR